MKAAVVVFPGSNCDRDCKVAVERSTGATVDMVWHQETALPAVIDWHRRGLVPLGRALADDPRCALVEGDFFALAAGPGFGRRFDAILLDIDHAPDALLHASHGGFYTADGLARLAERLQPGGVFAMWSDAAPDDRFLAALGAAFATPEARVVAFDNPLQEREATCTIYIARSPKAATQPR